MTQGLAPPGPCRTKHDAVASSLVQRFLMRAKACPSQATERRAGHGTGVRRASNPSHEKTTGRQEHVAMDRPLTARGDPLWKQARAKK